MSARTQHTSAQFSSTFNTYADDGLRSLDFEAIETGGGMRYAGNDEYAGDDTTNKWGGGGFVSSPRDLTGSG